MKAKLIFGGLAALFVAYLFWASVSLGKVSCEACVEFNGQRVCRNASGPSREEAVRTAVEMACGVLAAGRSESIRCGRQEPVSVRYF